jgi:hypothetical protein
VRNVRVNEDQEVDLDLDNQLPIEVLEKTAVCNGHPTDRLGHPTEFIRTNYDYAKYVF